MVDRLRGTPAGNSGNAAGGGWLNGTIRIAKWIGYQDNNVAEYLALLEALQCALGLKAKALHVFSDSEVVVKQMSGGQSASIVSALSTEIQAMQYPPAAANAVVLVVFVAVMVGLVVLVFFAVGGVAGLALRRRRVQRQQHFKGIVD